MIFKQEMYNFQEEHLQSIVKKHGRLFLIELACDCGNTQFLYDEHRDEVFCKNCGTVIKENMNYRAEFLVRISEVSP